MLLLICHQLNILYDVNTRDTHATPIMRVAPHNCNAASRSIICPHSSASSSVDKEKDQVPGDSAAVMVGCGDAQGGQGSALARAMAVAGP